MILECHQITMLLTFKILEHARNRGKKFPKLSQTSFSVIVYCLKARFLTSPIKYSQLLKVFPFLQELKRYVDTFSVDYNTNGNDDWQLVLKEALAFVEVSWIRDYTGQLKPGLHVRLITYDSIQTCSFIYHHIEIYTMILREYEGIGQTNRLV